MKNATKHADELKSLAKKLVKDKKAVPEPIAPLEALVRGAMSYDAPDDRVDAAMTAIHKEFVDLNEFRVATDLEIQSLLGGKYPAIEKRVAMATLALNNIFEREHTMNLDRLKTVSKRDARQFLRELPEIHPFVEAYVMLFGFEGNAFPIDDEMLAYLADQEIVEEGTTLADAQKFVENQLKADELYGFYLGLRAAAAERAAKKKK